MIASRTVQIIENLIYKSKYESRSHTPESALILFFHIS
ncbi:hypothetical protein FM107_13565 [Sphingobacterium sp. JB170]|nr:hypothetical protein FM107_13565 [Sphingobacterium sp. JB170]